MHQRIVWYHHRWRILNVYVWAWNTRIMTVKFNESCSPNTRHSLWLPEPLRAWHHKCFITVNLSQIRKMSMKSEPFIVITMQTALIYQPIAFFYSCVSKTNYVLNNFRHRKQHEKKYCSFWETIGLISVINIYFFLITSEV